MPSSYRPSRALIALAIALVPVVAFVTHDAGAQPKGPSAGTSTSAVPSGGKSAAPLGSASAGSGVGAPKLTNAKVGPPPKPEELWVGATSDDFITQLEKRAIRDGLAGGKFGIGAIMAIPQLADEARGGLARASLARITAALSADKKAEARELANEAIAISRSIAADAGLPSSRVEDAKLGLVSAWRIAGPFKDTSGQGLDKAEGPEVPAPEKLDGKPISIALFRQTDINWDDGPFQVEWRSVPPEMISARDTPLEGRIYPRKESCS
jgi:hypothetical protein